MPKWHSTEKKESVMAKQKVEKKPSMTTFWVDLGDPSYSAPVPEKAFIPPHLSFPPFVAPRENNTEAKKGK